jgi:hypothetical protein
LTDIDLIDADGRKRTDLAVGKRDDICFCIGDDDRLARRNSGEREFLRHRFARGESGDERRAGQCRDLASPESSNCTVDNEFADADRQGLREFGCGY